MKKTIYECDVCHKQMEYLEEDTLIIKAKRKWISFYESGMTRVKIIICPECQNRLGICEQEVLNDRNK